MAESVYQGDTFQVQVTITDQDTGAAVDVSSAAITWVLSKSIGGTAALTKTKAAGEIVVSGASSNIATVTVDAGDTDGLTGGYWSEMQVTDGSGNIYTVHQERINIKAETV